MKVRFILLLLVLCLIAVPIAGWNLTSELGGENKHSRPIINIIVTANNKILLTMDSLSNIKVWAISGQYLRFIQWINQNQQFPAYKNNMIVWNNGQKLFFVSNIGHVNVFQFDTENYLYVQSSIPTLDIDGKVTALCVNQLGDKIFLAINSQYRGFQLQSGAWVKFFQSEIFGTQVQYQLKLINQETTLFGYSIQNLGVKYNVYSIMNLGGDMDWTQNYSQQAYNSVQMSDDGTLLAASTNTQQMKFVKTGSLLNEIPNFQSDYASSSGGDFFENYFVQIVNNNRIIQYRYQISSSNIISVSQIDRISLNANANITRVTAFNDYLGQLSAIAGLEDGSLYIAYYPDYCQSKIAYNGVSQCVECNPNYAPVILNNIITKCCPKIQKCKTYHQSCFCEVCQEGYYRIGGNVCLELSTDQRCLKFDSISRVCLRCQGKYLPDSNGICVLRTCPPGQQLDSDGSCKKSQQKKP